MEFWRNLLVSIARGQEQLEDMMRWVHQGSPGAHDLTNLFRKAYGLNQFPQAPTGQPEVWKETIDRFHQAYRDYLKLLDIVPRAEYEKLRTRTTRSRERSRNSKGSMEICALSWQRKHMVRLEWRWTNFRPLF